MQSNSDLEGVGDPVGTSTPLLLPVEAERQTFAFLASLAKGAPMTQFHLKDASGDKGWGFWQGFGFPD